MLGVLRGAAWWHEVGPSEVTVANEEVAMTDMKVHILSAGAATAAGLRADGGLLVRTDPRTSPVAWDDTPASAVLIEHTDGRVLWDTGVAPDWPTLWGAAGRSAPGPLGESADPSVRTRGQLAGALARLDLTPDDIDIVVLSNLQLDHDLHRFDPAKTRVVASAAELAAVRGVGDRAASAVTRPRVFPIEAIEEETEVLPGIQIVRSSADAWATTALRLDIDTGDTTIFAVDTAPVPADLTDGWDPTAHGWDPAIADPAPSSVGTCVDRFALAVREAVAVSGVGGPDGPYAWLGRR